MPAKPVVVGTLGEGGDRFSTLTWFGEKVELSTLS